MAVVGVVIKTALAFLIFFTVKQLSLLSSNSCCYSNYPKEAPDIKDDHITASIWCYKQEHNLCLRPKSALTILLILAGDVELCPGRNGKCSTCQKTIRRNQCYGYCTTCKNKFHAKCLVDLVDEQGKEVLYCQDCHRNEDMLEIQGELIGPVYEKLNDFLQKRGLKVFHQNVNGLLRKLESIQLMFQETNKSIHVYGLSETHLTKDIGHEEITVNGYSFIRKDRTNGNGGGVGCYIGDDIKWKRRLDLEKNSIEAIWIEILIEHSSSVLLCIIYRPPASSRYIDPDFEANFEMMIRSANEEKREMIIAGDMNCDYLKKSELKPLKRILQLI